MSHVFVGLLEQKLFRKTKGCQKKSQGCIIFSMRYEWAINVLTGFVRESQAVLDLQPSHEDTLQCACRGPLRQVDYGKRIPMSHRKFTSTNHN